MYIPAFCWKPWHPECELFRVSRMRRRIYNYIDHHDDPPSYWYSVTRSVRNDLSLHQAFDDLRDAQRLFSVDTTDHEDHPFNRVPAYVAVTEVTWKFKTGYNVHQHAIVKSEVEWQEGQVSYIRDSWNKSAGYPAHFHIRSVNNIERAAAYLAKYNAKECWGGLSRGRAYATRDTLKGRNRINCKRGTIVPSTEVAYSLCCLPPKEYCSHPSMVIPSDQFQHDQTSS